MRTTVVTVATTALLTGGAASAAAAGREKPPAADPDAQQAARAPQSEAGPGNEAQSGPDALPRSLSPEAPPPVPPTGPAEGPSELTSPEVRHAPVVPPERRPPEDGRAPETGRERPGTAADRDTRQSEWLDVVAWPEYALEWLVLPWRAHERTHRAAHAGRRLATASTARARAKATRRARHAKRARARAGGRHAVKSFAYHLVRRKWGPGQFRCLDRLWTRESNWNHRAVNPRSGAYGIPQALPAHKMRVSGRDWRHNPVTQVRWGLRYIKSRYGTP
ncbi:MAG: transglycosylase SLT domain-containing protein, partial [Actinomycetes bacterium]